MRYLRGNYQSMYNRLPSTSISSDRLKSRVDFQDILVTLGALIDNAGLGHVLQVRLLHRHYSLGSSAVMIEALEMRNGEQVLRTRSQRLDEVTRECIPAIWRPLPDGGIEAHEFGDASLYAIAPGFFDANRDLFASFAAKVEQFGLTGVLGLSLHSDVLGVDPAIELHAEFLDDEGTYVSRFPRQGVAGFAEVYQSTWNSRGEASGDCVTCFDTMRGGHGQQHNAHQWPWQSVPEEENDPAKEDGAE